MKVVVLDSTPLAEFCRKKPKVEVFQLINFFKENKIALRVAEITEYELKRELLRAKKYKSDNRLNKYYLTERIIPINRNSLIRAAEIWAELRNSGMLTAGTERIDIDTIMIAQSLLLKKSFEEVIILTGDPEDISRFCNYGVKVWWWEDALKTKDLPINYYNSNLK